MSETMQFVSVWLGVNLAIAAAVLLDAYGASKTAETKKVGAEYSRHSVSFDRGLLPRQFVKSIFGVIPRGDSGTAGPADG